MTAEKLKIQRSFGFLSAERFLQGIGYVMVAMPSKAAPVIDLINRYVAKHYPANHPQTNLGGMLIQLSSSLIKDEQTADAISCMYRFCIYNNFI
jgi:hypothetical protein